jgi:hypothetical protein
MNRDQDRPAEVRLGGRAAPLSPAMSRVLFDEAVRCRQAKAERLCRQILAVDPLHAESLRLLGLMAYHAGHYAAAIRIVEHRGLAWDDACLAFYDARRPVRTAGALQVRRPIYPTSVGRWRPYADLLGPLIEALGPEE